MSPPRLTRRRALPLLVAGASATAGLAACQPAKLIRRDTSRRLVLRINLYGSAAYASLMLMRDRALLEKAVPSLTVEWKIIPQAETIHEALENGGLDLAIGPPTAFLLAREAGLPVRLVAALAALPCAILAKPRLRTLAGLRPTEKVAVPEQTSFELAVLELAALRDLGDARALRNRVVVQSHAEALVAMKQDGEVSAHVAVSPFVELELQGPGPVKLLDARELFSKPPTTSLVYAMTALRERAGPLLAAFTETLAQASKQTRSDPLGTARLLSEVDELHASPQQIGEILARSGWELGAQISGVSRIAELWRRTDRLHEPALAWSDLAFPGVQGD